MKETLAGRSAIITGASSGLGYSIAREFLAQGSRVAICGRDGDALTDAACHLAEVAGPDRILSVVCDVASEQQVRGLVHQALDAFGSIEILVNNAGVLGPTGKTEEVDLDEWRRTFEINFYGVLLVSRALIPHMRSRRYGKIINLSGGGATSPRPFFTAYATSKAAVVRLTENLTEELCDAGIDVNAIAPGALNTRMLAEALAAGPERIGDSQFERLIRQKETGGGSIERAAQLCVYLASPATDGLTGRLISAAWDPWPALHERIDELRSTDIYTLRRIVPEDRAKHWI